MLHGLAEAIRNFDSDDKSSVGILCGVGGNFSIGYDLDELSTALETHQNILENIMVGELIFGQTTKDNIVIIFTVRSKSNREAINLLHFWQLFIAGI